MGFKKEGYEAEVAVEVRHAWYSDTTFVFYFPKRLPQRALDAEAAFLAVTDEEGRDASRIALINAVAELAVRAPEGFDDFPAETPGSAVNTLADRARAYFDDSSKPELEQIVSAAWAAYKQGARPAAYLKSVSHNSAADGDVSGVSGEAPPVG